MTGKITKATLTQSDKYLVAVVIRQAYSYKEGKNINIPKFILFDPHAVLCNFVHLTRASYEKTDGTWYTIQGSTRIGNKHCIDWYVIPEEHVPGFIKLVKTPDHDAYDMLLPLVETFEKVE